MAAVRLRHKAKNFVLNAQDGSVLMEIRRVEFKGSDLLIRGKMMGTMPTVASMRPEEVWKALTMVPFKVIIYLPVRLFRAWRSAGKPPKAQQHGTVT